MIDLVFDMPNENQLLARLNAFPLELQARLKPVIERLTEKMLAEVQAREPVRTGALRSETHAFVNERPDSIKGRVRILTKQEADPKREAIKAAALEYGAHGTASVSAHAMSLDHVFADPIAPEEVAVDAYQRDVNITARRFLRDSLADTLAEFEIEVQRVMTEAVGGFNLTQVSTI